ncbi:nickel pincer cofactor biosynthesis protein LarB [Rhabdothermincola salaria]|uniref:nickel pincer cofactor biosynthesis protein LarB n=1 Tax=Rhabdothermincola salaria TaxID=2903142 RepID=UPI001E3264B0|nr:nickel pincer cofactor biosynthesis protein LarB [Rhabdothermincola salaria]MCD9624188.1 nickel pincer cofactor biosynthesis protein LarB [Rhabdothermincola salaria]
MDEMALRGLVDGIRSGTVSADDAVAQLRRLPFADLGFARIDHHRQLRQGMAEAVYAPGKSPEHCAAIVGELLAQPGSTPVLLSRADGPQREAALGANPGGRSTEAGAGDPAGRTLHTIVWRPAAPRPERVAVVAAGTADLPVAEEAAVTLAAHGLDPLRITDIGVAGLHRVLDAVDELVACDALVVVAGMEGALSSVVAGLTAAPVVAVPTSVGYGSGLAGVTALLGMMASCASGLSVVGIDNGFGAACAVLRMLNTSTSTSTSTSPSGSGRAVQDAAGSPAAWAPAGGASPRG